VKHPTFVEDSTRYQEAKARLDLLYFEGLLRALGQGYEPELPQIAAAIGRTDRHLAALRAIEAIRAFSAKHGNALPAGLAEITNLPGPTDPVLRKPFDYKASGRERATLSAAAPSGAQDEQRMTLQYELTLLPEK
jgi:hypothetical protein